MSDFEGLRRVTRHYRLQISKGDPPSSIADLEGDAEGWPATIGDGLDGMMKGGPPPSVTALEGMMSATKGPPSDSSSRV